MIIIVHVLCYHKYLYVYKSVTHDTSEVFAKIFEFENNKLALQSN
jgi:hypothetical protein